MHLGVENGERGAAAIGGLLGKALLQGLHTTPGQLHPGMPTGRERRQQQKAIKETMQVSKQNVAWNGGGW